jgi:hypothetical protein
MTKAVNNKTKEPVLPTPLPFGNLADASAAVAAEQQQDDEPAAAVVAVAASSVSIEE